MEQYLRGHALWQGADASKWDATREGLEKFLMAKLYGKVFGAGTEEREKDAALERRIRTLGFVELHHLDLGQFWRGMEGSWAFAQAELRKINDYKVLPAHAPPLAADAYGSSRRRRETNWCACKTRAASS